MKTSRIRRIAALAVGAVLLALPAVVVAEDYTFLGGQKGAVWSDRGNWSGHTVPTSGLDTKIFLGNSGGTFSGTIRQDLGEFSLSRLEFTAGGSYTLEGDPITLGPFGSISAHGQGAGKDGSGNGDSSYRLVNDVVFSAGQGSPVTIETTTNNVILASGTWSGNAACVAKVGTGTLILGGTGNWNGGTVVNEGTLVVQSTDALPRGHELDVSRGATLEIDGGRDATSVQVSTLQSDGTLRFVDGQYGRTVSVSDHGEVSGMLTGQGVLEMAGPGRMDLTGASFGGFTGSLLASRGTLAVSTAYGGTIELHGGTVEIGGSASGRLPTLFGTDGSLVKSGPSTVLVSQALDYRGSTAVTGGTLSFVTATRLVGPLSVASGATFENASGGTLTVSGQVVNEGNFATRGGSTTVFQGLVSGSGGFSGFGTVDFEGVYSPGDSPTSVLLQGDMVVGANGALVMELGGTALGTGYDHLTVLGRTTLGGLLDVRLFGGFSPSAGDSFDLFDSVGQTGAFSTLSLPNLGSGLAWDTRGLYSQGVIRVLATPEPSTLAALSLGALVLLRRRRK